MTSLDYYFCGDKSLEQPAPHAVRCYHATSKKRFSKSILLLGVDFFSALVKS